MTVLRFFWILFEPVLMTLCLPILIVAWIILATLDGLMDTWKRAQR